MSDGRAPAAASGAMLDFTSAARILESLAHAGASSGEVPGYHLDRLLGQGGGGRVYRAFKDGSDQPLALKVLNAPLGAGSPTARVWREIDLLASLRLPGVARLLYHGTHEGRIHFAAEFIDGTSLADLGRSLHRGGTPDDPGPYLTSLIAMDAKPRLRACVELLARLADAVQSIHEHGVIHRDLKPGNVIVTPRGDPVLVDFGLATLLDDHQMTLTAEGAPIGTPAFMSPEQARGERGLVSTRSDVWGLGATACWLLTGATPFDTDCSLHEAVRRVGHDAPRDPKALRPDLPKPLAAVLAKATAPDPARRYPTAAELAADLRRFARGEPVHAGTPGPWQRTLRWIARHPVAATATLCAATGATILAVALVATLTAIHFALREPARFEFFGNADRPTSARLVSLGGATLAVIGRPDGNEVVRHASVIDWPPQLTAHYPGDKAAVIAVHPNEGEGGTRGHVWVCDPFDLTRPALPTPPVPVPPPSPQPYPDYPAVTSVLTRVIEQDLYPDLPGPEYIVVAEQVSEQTPNVIYVQDLLGNVLFEAWHFGHIGDARWWPEHRLLILAADRHGKQTHQWAQVDHPEAQAVGPPGPAPHYPFPRVLFALRLDARGRHGWLRDSRDASPDDPSRPLAWYKAVWPPRASVLFGAGKLPPVTPPEKAAAQMIVHLPCNDGAFERVTASGGAFQSWLGGATQWTGGWDMLVGPRGEFLGPRQQRADGWPVNFPDGIAGAQRLESHFTLVDFPTGIPEWRGEP